MLKQMHASYCSHVWDAWLAIYNSEPQINNSKDRDNIAKWILVHEGFYAKSSTRQVDCNLLSRYSNIVPRFGGNYLRLCCSNLTPQQHQRFKLVAGSKCHIQIPYHRVAPTLRNQVLYQKATVTCPKPCQVHPSSATHSNCDFAVETLIMGQL